MVRHPVIGLAVMSVLTAGAGHTQEYFHAPLPFSIYNAPTSFAIGDINRDGVLDIVAVGRNEATRQGFVTVIYGKGDGTFVSKNEMPAEYFPVDVEVEDLDRDGQPDIVTANEGVQTLNFWINQGGMAFKKKDPIKIKGEPKMLAVGDYNRDGNRDFVLLMGSSSELQFFKGTGKAQAKFVASWTLEHAPDHVQFNNFSETGYDQILIKYRDASYVSLLSPVEKSGKWAFPGVRIDMYSRPLFARQADIDGDGFEDALVLEPNSGELRVIRSEANGLLLDQVGSVKVPDGARSFDLGDFNGDAHMDVAVLDEQSAQILIYINSATGHANPKGAPTRTVIYYPRDDSKPRAADVGMLSSFKSVSMALYDGEGKLIRKYFEFDSSLPDGQFTLEWNGTDENDVDVPDGSYIFYYRLGSIVVIRHLQKP